MISAQIQKAKS